MLDQKIRIDTYRNSPAKQQFFFSNNEKGAELLTIAEKYDLHHDEMYKQFVTTVGDIILGFYKIEDTVPLLQQELGLDPRTTALLGADVLDFLAPLSDPNWQPPVEEGEEEDMDSPFKESTADNTNDWPEENIFTQTATTTPQITNHQPHSIPPVFDDTTSSIPAVEPITPVSPKPPQPNRTIPIDPALHTMATDMEKTRGTNTPSYEPTPNLNLEDADTYVSQNQDSLRQPLSNTPSYTAPPVPPPPPHNPEPPRWSSQ